MARARSRNRGCGLSFLGERIIDVINSTDLRAVGVDV
jgi:hypothetical protein